MTLITSKILLIFSVICAFTIVNRCVRVSVKQNKEKQQGLFKHFDECLRILNQSYNKSIFTTDIQIIFFFPFVIKKNFDLFMQEWIFLISNLGRTCHSFSNYMQ